MLIETLSAPARSSGPRVLHRAHPAADADSGMKQTSAVRAITSRIGAAALVAGGDVEEHQLVRARRVIGLGLLDRIAGVAQGEELHALDHAPVLHVQAGDDADLEHQAACAGAVSASAGSMAPV